MDGPNRRSLGSVAMAQGISGAAVRASSGRADEPPDYLAPKRARRGYGDRAVTADGVRLRRAAVGEPPPLEYALQAMLNAHALDWSRTSCATVGATCSRRPGASKCGVGPRGS